MQTKLFETFVWRNFFNFQNCRLTEAWLLLKLNPSTNLRVFQKNVNDVFLRFHMFLTMKSFFQNHIGNWKFFHPQRFCL